MRLALRHARKCSDHDYFSIEWKARMSGRTRVSDPHAHVALSLARKRAPYRVDGPAGASGVLENRKPNRS